MTDIYLSKVPMLSNLTTGMYKSSQACHRVNIKNWRFCAANAADRGQWNEVERCQRKARKIAGWLEDLIEEEGGFRLGELGD